jgi:hypothetical protein
LPFSSSALPAAIVRLGVEADSPSQESLPIELLTKTTRESALTVKVVQPLLPPCAKDLSIVKDGSTFTS